MYAKKNSDTLLGEVAVAVAKVLVGELDSVAPEEEIAMDTEDCHIDVRAERGVVAVKLRHPDCTMPGRVAVKISEVTTSRGIEIL